MSPTQPCQQCFDVGFSVPPQEPSQAPAETAEKLVIELRLHVDSCLQSSASQCDDAVSSLQQDVISYLEGQIITLEGYISSLLGTARDYHIRAGEPVPTTIIPLVGPGPETPTRPVPAPDGGDGTPPMSLSDADCERIARCVLPYLLPLVAQSQQQPPQPTAQQQVNGSAQQAAPGGVVLLSYDQLERMMAFQSLPAEPEETGDE